MFTCLKEFSIAIVFTQAMRITRILLGDITTVENLKQYVEELVIPTREGYYIFIKSFTPKKSAILFSILFFTQFLPC